MLLQWCHPSLPGAGVTVIPPRYGQTMTTYIYEQSGQAVGFISGRHIHDLRGHAIGQIRNTHVHKLSGTFVGELEDQMVLDKHLGNLGNIGHPGNPGSRGSPGNPGSRGNLGSRGYSDVFYKLHEG